jgi:hypothetical protein
LRLGVIVDLHTHWDNVDVAQFAGTDYDLLYFTGDLGGGTPDSRLRMARAMAGLRHPTLVMPGNNDTVDIEQLAAELAHQIRGGDPPGKTAVSRENPVNRRSASHSAGCLRRSWTGIGSSADLPATALVQAR